MTGVQLRLSQGQFRVRPWLAHERGWSAVGIGLGATTADAVIDWKSLLETSQRDLEVIDVTGLTAKERATHSSLEAWIRVEIALVELQRTALRDPVFYVDRVERTLRALLASDALSDRDRIQEVVLILGSLPKYWEHARQGLSTPTEAWSSEAIPRIHDLGVWMQFELAESLAGKAGSASAKSTFDSLLVSAVLAAGDFRQWLADSPAREGRPATPLDKGTWEIMARDLSGTELNMNELRARLLRDIADLDGRLLPRDGAGDLDESSFEPSQMLPIICGESRRAMFFANKADLITGIPGAQTQLRARIVQGMSIPGCAVRPRQAKRNAGWLDIEPRGILWKPAVRETRARLFTPAGQRAIGVRYGFPGEMLGRYESNLAAVRKDPVIRNRATLEGWGLYALDWLLRVNWYENPYAEDPEFLSAAAYSLVLEASRLLAAIELHHDHLPTQEVTDAFARRTGFDVDSAGFEISQALHDPFHGIGYLGYVELLTNERKLAESSLPAIALMNAVRFSLTNMHLRPADMRNNLFPWKVR